MGWLVAPVGRLPPPMGLTRSPPRGSPALALLHRVLRSCCGGGGIATLCYRGMSDRVEGGVMSTIPHRERRNNSTEILRRVEKGETFSITNHGRTVARLVPYTASPLDVLRESGRVTGAKKVDLAALPAVHGLSSKDVLDDLRGER